MFLLDLWVSLLWLAHNVEQLEKKNCYMYHLFSLHKKNGNSVIDYVLLFEGILDRIHKFGLGELTWECDHMTIIDLKSLEMSE